MDSDYKTCKADGCENKFRPYRTTDKYCSYKCFRKMEKEKPKKKRIIRPMSKKHEAIVRQYSKDRIQFLRKPENRRCAVYPDLSANQVHHKMGKIGFADNFARENNIPLWLDQRYWLAVSADGHEWIEKNPKEAKKLGYSIDRLSKK